MKVQSQSGLGDLIFALPLIYDISQREEVHIASNHPYVLDKATSWGDFAVHPVEIGTDGFPIIKDGFTHLRYDRYGTHYFERYYTPYGKLPLEDAIKEVRKTYMIGRDRKIAGPYAVYAPPRAANRHRYKIESERWSCTPNPYGAEEIIETYQMPIVLVGKNDEYYPDQYFPERSIDLRDQLNFEQLSDMIANAYCVISQISAITALAGLFAIKTNFLKASAETEDQHDRHIQSIIWPNQERLK